MGQTESRDLKCVVLNSGGVISLRISEASTGQDLKDAIQQQNPVYFDCASISLLFFVARKAERTWLSVNAEQLQQMQQGVVPYEIFKTTKDEANALNPWAPLSRFKFSRGGPLKEDDFNVLVQKPGRLDIEPTWKKPQPPPLYTLLDGVMHCVRQDDTTKQLQDVHRTNYKRFQDTNQVRNGIIRLADSMLGLGKTTLGNKYIQWCREMWPDEENRSEFQRELCACRTIYLSSPSFELLGGRIHAELVKKELVKAVNSVQRVHQVEDPTLDFRQRNNICVIQRSFPSELTPVQDLGQRKGLPPANSDILRQIDWRSIDQPLAKKFSNPQKLGASEHDQVNARDLDPLMQKVLTEQEDQIKCFRVLGTSEPPIDVVKDDEERPQRLHQRTLQCCRGLSQAGASLSPLVLAPLIDAETANVDDWRQLVQEIRGLLDGLEDESFCFKFRPHSLSVDALFVTRNTFEMHAFGDNQKLPRPSYWSTRTLTVGLIVRELNVSAFDVDALHVECMRFNAMFERLDDETQTAFGYMTNVLVVGVPGCSDELSELFGNDSSMAPPKDCEHISDIVLLDLTTSKKRAEVFGFVGSDEGTQFLIDSVDKIVNPGSEKSTISCGVK